MKLKSIAKVLDADKISVYNKNGEYVCTYEYNDFMNIINSPFNDEFTEYFKNLNVLTVGTGSNREICLVLGFEDLSRQY